MIIQSLRNIMGVLYPTSCFSCEEFLSLSPGMPVCDACYNKLVWIANSVCESKTTYLDTIHTVWEYRGIVPKMIHMLKINQASYLNSLVEHGIKQYLGLHDLTKADIDCIVPIPPHTHRTQNTASITQTMTRILSNELKVPVRSMVKRKHRTNKQSSLPKHLRLENPIGSMFVKKQTPKSKSILLVDDIITTGKTADECAKVLKQHTASTVHVFGIARG